MTSIRRRSFLNSSLGALGAAGAAGLAAKGNGAARPSLSLAPFRFDVTPPMGHPLCGGWIMPVVGYDDKLEAIGFVLHGAGAPIVVCAVDWTGILNGAHVQWRKTLAQAAGTAPERVAVQCVHQHNALFACVDAERIVQARGDLPHVVQLDFFNQCLDRGAKAVANASKGLRPLTHVAVGQGKVDKVASNRRIIGANGKIADWRGSASKNPTHQQLPEGLIDPLLKTIAFYDGAKKVLACHYYATHPMSYYGNGRVSSDFVGLARKRRQNEEPACTHIYFTGCSGNIAAGKYNDGSPLVRVQLTERIYNGIVASEVNLKPTALDGVAWKTKEVLPTPRAGMSMEKLEAEIRSSKAAFRNRSALHLAWLRRCADKTPIVLSALHLNEATMLHLPAECFVEYQLRAQRLSPKRFVATAAYGDGGPWYIPVQEAYPQGGYEVGVALCEPTVDPLLSNGIRNLLTAMEA